MIPLPPSLAEEPGTDQTGRPAVEDADGVTLLRARSRAAPRLWQAPARATVLPRRRGNGRSRSLSLPLID